MTEDFPGQTRGLHLKEAIFIKKAKCLSEEVLQIAVEKKKERSEKQRRKGKMNLFECRVPKNSKGI